MGPAAAERGSRLLVLVRHAKAASGEEGADRERELTQGGHRAAAAGGRWLAGVLREPELVWCSDAVRATQTWAAMAPALEAGEVVVERDLYLASPRDVLDRLEGSTARSMVVVGHNPTMEQVLASLTGELTGMRPGAVVVLDLSDREVVASWQPPR